MLNLTDIRSRVDRAIVRRNQVLQSINVLKEDISRIDKGIEESIAAQHIFQLIAQTIQQRIHHKISAVVTRCLEAVFDDPYEFSIRFDRQRGKTEARLVFSRNGQEFDDPLNEVGGGVIDVASIALRLSAILLSRPMLRRVLILDEPFKNIRGEENRQRTRSMLVKLADDLGFQVILNTDIESFKLGQIIQLPLDSQ